MAVDLERLSLFDLEDEYFLRFNKIFPHFEMTKIVGKSNEEIRQIIIESIRAGKPYKYKYEYNFEEIKDKPRKELEDIYYKVFDRGFPIDEDFFHMTEEEYRQALLECLRTGKEYEYELDEETQKLIEDPTVDF